jgi:hypothetical protein
VTIPMFDPPAAGRPQMPSRTVGHVSATPAWSRYRPARPQRCDFCMRVLAENAGTGPFPKDAKWRRRADGEITLLCHGHAQEQRHADRMPPLRGPKR